MTKTKIDWCDYTWNPVWGCRNTCPYCYARKTAQRWCHNFAPHWMENNFNRVMPKKPSRIFVNSMSEIAYWEPEWWEKVIARIVENPQHTFLFLTKNPAIYNSYPLPMNCWLGATATTQNEVDIYQRKLAFFDAHNFLSIEPILEKIDPSSIKRKFIDWVILGAETGNRKKRVIPPPEWIEPWLKLPIPLYMKRNLPWDRPWRREFP